MPFPIDRAPDDELLTSYLLGKLPEAEAERLDELSVADDSFAVRLTAVGHDLIDSYVRGELTGDTLDRFKSHFLTSTVMRDQIRFAEALLAYQQRPTVGRGIASNQRRMTTPAVRWGLAAAAALLLAASGYLIVENTRLRHQISQSQSIRASLEARERELQRQLEERRSADAETARELARVRESLTELEARAASSRSANQTVVASFLLMAGKRGPGDITTISIPRAANVVTLRMEPEATGFARYRVVLKDPANDRIVWRSAELKAASVGGTKTVDATLPAALLRPRIFVAELVGSPAPDATRGFAGSYAFRVVLQ
jgi:hypothetical protein